MAFKKKSAIKLNEFWKYDGKLLLRPDIPDGKIYFLKEKDFKMIKKIYGI